MLRASKIFRVYVVIKYFWWRTYLYIRLQNINGKLQYTRNIPIAFFVLSICRVLNITSPFFWYMPKKICMLYFLYFEAFRKNWNKMLMVLNYSWMLMSRFYAHWDILRNLILLDLVPRLKLLLSQAACAYGVLATRSCQIKSHNQQFLFSHILYWKWHILALLAHARLTNSLSNLSTVFPGRQASTELKQ